MISRGFGFCATWSLFTLLGSACNGGDIAPPAMIEEDGRDRGESRRTGRGSGDDEPDAGTTSEAGVAEPDGSVSGAEPVVPSVTILTPTNEHLPVEVYNESLAVRCEFEAQDGSELDTSTVFFELVNTDGEVLQSQPGVRVASPAVYEVTFPVQNVESGEVEVRCGVSDNATMPKRGTATARTFVDHGPLVAIVAPADGAAESALGAVAFEYQIAPDDLVDDDPGAAIASVRLTVLGEQFELSEADDDRGVFRTTIDFADPEVFNEVPSGSVQVAAAATNQRGITRTRRYTFVLDGKGPTVSIRGPRDTQIIGGTVTLTMDIEDAVSSVDWDTLEVQLNDGVFPYDANGPWDIDEKTARFTFETGQITGSVVQINLNVRVKDVAGNPSSGASALYYRDEQAPIVMLDPPNFRIVEANRNPYICSLAFDPLGSSPAHGERVLDVARYRALVWDETNAAPGQEVLYLSGVDPGSVDLFVRRPGVPLVIDTTGDGVCDDVDTEGARFQELTALDRQGNARFSLANSDQGVSPMVDETFCNFVDRNPPKRLCDEEASDLTIVIDQPRYQDESVIYAVSPDRDLECTGRGWELRSAGLSGYQGWVCLAVRAHDRVGNRGVSKPIAVCLENDQVDGLPSCHEDLDELPPDCTDGCSDPPALLPTLLLEL